VSHMDYLVGSLMDYVLTIFLIGAGFFLGFVIAKLTNKKGT
jgi:hypothetical protein